MTENMRAGSTMEPEVVVPVEVPPTDIVASANLAAQRLEAATLAATKLFERQQALAVQATLGGESSAGDKPVSLTDDEQKDKNARDFLAGTGLNID